MTRKIQIVLAVLAGVLLLLVVVVALQPSEFHVERSAAMNAPAERIFAEINDFHRWDAWSPWLELDPQAKNTFEGPTSGEGAIFRWAGNRDVGEGSMTILESQPSERLRIELGFVKPFAGTALTEFKLQPQGEQTRVTWSMDGTNNFIAKAMCLFLMDMDKMIGGKYEEGLAKIKALVERPASNTPQPVSAAPLPDQATSPAAPSAPTPSEAAPANPPATTP